MKDRNTTIAGILTIVAAVANAGIEFATHKPVNVPVLIGGIVTGRGLIVAADSKPSA